MCRRRCQTLADEQAEHREKEIGRDGSHGRCVLFGSVVLVMAH